MGCCMSYDHENTTKHDPHFPPCLSKSPPRPEEETVKEVLSVTPHPRTNVGPDPDPELEPDEVLFLTSIKPNTVISQKHLPIYPIKSPGSGRVCTTPELEEGDHGTHDDGSEVLQRVYKYKPQGQNGNFTCRSNRGGMSPGRRRSNPSPTRDGNPGRSPGGQVEGQRRSRSPVTRSNNNVGQSPSRRRVGASPGRVRMVSGLEKEDEREKMEGVIGRRNGNEWDGPNESLENPLVSLECFIFL